MIHRIPPLVYRTPLEEMYWQRARHRQKLDDWRRMGISHHGLAGARKCCCCDGICTACINSITSKGWLVAISGVAPLTPCGAGNCSDFNDTFVVDVNAFGANDCTHHFEFPSAVCGVEFIQVSIGAFFPLDIVVDIFDLALSVFDRFRFLFPGGNPADCCKPFDLTYDAGNNTNCDFSSASMRVSPL